MIVSTMSLTVGELKRRWHSKSMFTIFDINKKAFRWTERHKEIWYKQLKSKRSNLVSVTIVSLPLEEARKLVPDARNADEIWFVVEGNHRLYTAFELSNKDPSVLDAPISVHVVYGLSADSVPQLFMEVNSLQSKIRSVDIVAMFSKCGDALYQVYEMVREYNPAKGMTHDSVVLMLVATDAVGYPVGFTNAVKVLRNNCEINVDRIASFIEKTKEANVKYNHALVNYAYYIYMHTGVLPKPDMKIPREIMYAILSAKNGCIARKKLKVIGISEKELKSQCSSMSKISKYGGAKRYVCCDSKQLAKIIANALAKSVVQQG